ncbi:MAG: hypothetical protein AB1486_25055 [Planctomycetota bacterium]
MSLILVALSCMVSGIQESGSFGIHVVDAATQRGVPLITLETTNRIRLVTDSAGRVAFLEPGLMDRAVYFSVSGPGYSYPQDGFGFAGVTLRTTPGARAEIKVARTIIAERLCRLTGTGIYRDSELLGDDVAASLVRPSRGVASPVMGQDSVQVTAWRGRLLWIWGDTSLARYPLGNFHGTGALTDHPAPGGLDPIQGVSFEYLLDDDGNVRRMMPVEEPGAVWLDGLLAVADAGGKEVVLAHYARMKSLGEQLEHGIARLDEEGVFRKVKELPAASVWQHPRGHAVQGRERGGDYLYFAAPFCTTRVPARAAAIMDPAAYEALAWDGGAGSCVWQKVLDPITQATEAQLIKEASLPASSALLQVTDAGTHKAVTLHAGSVRWNDFRQRWILIAVELGGDESFLGEVWYVEAQRIEGPWGKGVKVASHPSYSFYNPCHHDFFDQEGGKVIYFEGTYSETFSGAKVATPRYDYNQLLYRLDLSDARLAPARVE